MDRELERVADAAGNEPDLTLFVLFGSRARGDAHPKSDWDFGFLAGPAFDPDRLRVTLVEALRTERVDLVDLARAGALLRFRAAREGIALRQAPGAFERFQFEASSFWCEVEPVLRRAWADTLREL